MSGIIDDEENELEEVKSHKHLGICGRHSTSTIHRSRFVKKYHDEVLKKRGGEIDGNN